MRTKIAMLLSAIIGVYVFIVELYLIYTLWGLIGIVIGLFLFPVLLLAMPFYAIFEFGDWSLLLLSLASVFLPSLVLRDWN